MFALSTLWTLAACAAPQEPAASPLDAVVLRQEGVDYSARQVLARVSAYDPSVAPALEADAEYRRLYLSSPVFYEHVRSFSDELMLDAEGVPAASPEALTAEARAWALDRGLPADPEAALARYGVEVCNRARLIALQPDGFGSDPLRQHMMRSVPEFFGQLQISWIRAPLFDPKTGAVLGERARREVWEELDAAARAMEDSELEWTEAVEKHSQDPVTRGRAGRVGIVSRDMTDRLEEELLRPLFADLGFRQPEGVLLRGPILTSRWAYLVRVEAVVVSGIVDLERVRPRVERSLRETMIRQRLAELAAGTERRILLPPEG